MTQLFHAHCPFLNVIESDLNKACDHRPHDQMSLLEPVKAGCLAVHAEHGSAMQRGISLDAPLEKTSGVTGTHGAAFAERTERFRGNIRLSRMGSCSVLTPGLRERINIYFFSNAPVF